MGQYMTMAAGSLFGVAPRAVKSSGNEELDIQGASRQSSHWLIGQDDASHGIQSMVGMCKSDGWAVGG
jgi:hypothetical protein